MLLVPTNLNVVVMTNKCQSKTVFNISLKTDLSERWLHVIKKNAADCSYP